VARRGLILFGAAMIGVPIATGVFLAASASGAVVSRRRKDSAFRARIRAVFAASS
jgi:hypothetical protein